MIRRLVLGLVWCVVLYFGACIVTGAVVGGRAGAGARSPEEAAAAGARASLEAVTALREYFLVGAMAVAASGTWVGFLPGTRPSQLR